MADKMKVGLMPGDGIGPEIADAVVEIFAAMRLPIEWVKVPSGEETLAKEGVALPQSSIDLVRELGVALKGPTGTPIGKGHKSANVQLRTSLDLYANVRPAFKLQGVLTPFENVDLIIVRENTEDVYTAIEHQVSPDVAQCLKVITRPGSERVIRYAFEMAKLMGRRRVTCVHKANIMKLTDGLFLKVFYEVAKDYSEVDADDCIVDAACMQLVTKPERFDVIVTENLYGDILSDLCAGLIGGLGLAGGANIGPKAAVFEAVHGTAPDIAGKGFANPTALLLSSVMMLKHLRFMEDANRLSQALVRTYQDGDSLTRDLGGKAGTEEFSKAVIKRLA